MSRVVLVVKLLVAVTLFSATIVLAPVSDAGGPPRCVRCWSYGSACHSLQCKCDALGGAVVNCLECGDNDYSCSCGPSF